MKVIDIANQEVGYTEKKSDYLLDEKYGNIGCNNYTKYARDLDKTNIFNGKKQGFAWCSVFVHWCFVKAYGLENAMKMLNIRERSASAGCREFASYFISKNKFYDSAKVGDVIFFRKSDKVTHTGIVVGVFSNKVQTIEGNTEAKYGVISNGGMVCRKEYNIPNSFILGFGRPDYELVGDNNNTSSSNESSKATTIKSTYTNPKTEFIKSVQKCIGAKVDGIAGPETLSKTITLKYNLAYSELVKVVQKELTRLGYDTKGIDGRFGNNTKKAVIQFQKRNGCIQDRNFNKRTKKLEKTFRFNLEYP